MAGARVDSAKEAHMRRMGIAVAAMLALAAMAAAQPAGEAHTPVRAPDCPAGAHAMIRTARLGLQFVQAGAIAPLCAADTLDVSTPLTLRLQRAPFEVRVPLESWSAERPDAPLLVAVSDEPGFADLMQAGLPLERVPYFGFGTSYAVTDYGDGVLITARHGGANPPPERYPGQHDLYGHNNVAEGRFNASGPGYKGFYVSRIARQHAFSDDLMAADAPATFVFYLDRRRDAVRETQGQPTDRIDLYEYEVIEITFAGG